MKRLKVNIIGAGLAGSEAAWQLARRGIEVDLFEMRPHKSTVAHQTACFGELVCSNSLRSNSLSNGVGLLKEEMRMLDSLIMEAADQTAIPAGSALAVDREDFAAYITDKISSHSLINVINQEVCELSDDVTIVASGPLSSDCLTDYLKHLTASEDLYFYDAIAPIVEKDSIDFSIAYYKSRYDKGSADYINCPLSKEEYLQFYTALIAAETAELHEFEKEIYFEACMPIEELGRRGFQTLLFGPLKPVGLETETVKPYAVVQLRRDNAVDTLYNLVGFQTHLTYSEQKRVFQLIPGLQRARFLRYGSMHRNTYLNSPKLLNNSYQLKSNLNIFFAGQITGVEGYVESAASGLLAGINCARYLKGEKALEVPNTCMIGALANYVADERNKNFQPMNANFGIMRLLKEVSKKERKEAYYPQSCLVIKEVFKDEIY